jgi:hypothetical protein
MVTSNFRWLALLVLVGCGGGGAESTGAPPAVRDDKPLARAAVHAELPREVRLDYLFFTAPTPDATPETYPVSVALSPSAANERRVVVSSRIFSLFKFDLTENGRMPNTVAALKNPLHHMFAALPPEGVATLAAGATWESGAESAEKMREWNKQGAIATTEQRSFRVHDKWMLRDGSAVVRLHATIYEHTADTEALRLMNLRLAARGMAAQPAGRTAIIGYGITDLLLPAAKSESGAVPIRSVSAYFRERRGLDDATPVTEALAHPTVRLNGFCPKSGNEPAVAPPLTAPRAVALACNDAR